MPDMQRPDYVYIRPPKAILQAVGRAVAEYAMLKDGDRVLLGVSGGKDSLTLLHVLRHLQKHAPIRFELAAITIDPQVPGFEPEKLKDYMAELSVPYFFEQAPIMELAQEKMSGDSYCAWCARMKRGLMYKIAREQGFNVLALGQHMDDLAESFMMSIFHNGQLRTMKAHYVNDEGDIRIIRPLIRVRENQTRDFAQAANLPIIKDNCPACFEMPTQRAYMKKLLEQESKLNKHLYANLLTAMKPLIADPGRGSLERGEFGDCGEQASQKAD
jgi:tRNA 2-thiocytidine biosynthesis protein TtcA